MTEVLTDFGWLEAVEAAAAAAIPALSTARRSVIDDQRTS